MAFCIRGFCHDWDKWAVVRRGEIETCYVKMSIPSGDQAPYKGVTGTFVKQERVCKSCGLTQVQIDKSEL